MNIADEIHLAHERELEELRRDIGALRYEVQHLNDLLRVAGEDHADLTTRYVTARQIADTARQFVTLDADLCEATGARRGELAIASLAVRHDLNLLCRMPCGCDDGTCPGLIVGST